MLSPEAMSTRTLATFLFVDIVDSTRIASKTGDSEWHTLLSRFLQMARRQLRLFGGQEVNETGDGLAISFRRPSPAIQCAWAIRGEAHGMGLQVRTGLHMGEVEKRGRSIVGVGMHITARIVSEAGPEEILVSQAVRDAEEGSGFEFQDQGSRSLKGVSGEWRLYSVEHVPAWNSPSWLTSWLKSPERRGVMVGILVSVLVLGLTGAYFWSRDTGTLDIQSLAAPTPTHRQVTFTGIAGAPSVSPDGRTIAYAERRGKRDHRLLVQELSGGEPMEIGQYEGISRVRWSPTGQHLLVGIWRSDEERELLLIPRLGGSARSFPYATDFDWSPDGRQYVYGDRNAKKLWFRDLSTGDTTSITLPDPFPPLNEIDWSPRDDRIALASVDEQTPQFAIWVIGTNGKAIRRIAEDTLPLGIPRWSPDGEAIYYLHRRGETPELIKVPVPYEVAAPLPAAEVVLAGIPIWDFTVFGDGNHVLYSRNDQYSNLWRITPGTSGEPKVKQLTHGTANKGSFSVSPDGESIALSVGGFRRSNIHVLRMGNGAMEQLTYLDGWVRSPAWSPDGAEIAFGSNHGGKARVWVVNVAKGTPQPLENTQISPWPGDIAWSPGQQILYQRPGNRSFHLLDPETGEEQPLISGDEVGGIYEPRVSPDGKHVAVNSRRGPWGLWVVSLADGVERLIAEGNLWPAGWSHDGEWIYAEGAEGFTSPTMTRYSLQGDSTEVVVSLVCGDGVNSVGMTPDERHFLCLGSESISDIWLAESFDPEGASPIR